MIKVGQKSSDIKRFANANLKIVTTSLLGLFDSEVLFI